MSRLDPASPQARERLRVFCYLKREMKMPRQCPTAVEVSQATGIRVHNVQAHLQALRDADGLPFSVPSGVERRVASHEGRVVWNFEDLCKVPAYCTLGEDLDRLPVDVAFESGWLR